MANIALGITCNRPLPDPPGGPPVEAGFTFGDGSVRIEIADIGSDRCSRVLELIERSGIRIRAFNFALEPPPDCWAYPDGTWVGAVLEGGDVAAIDPTNTFDPALPRPCYGIVPPDRPIRVLEKPQGDVVGVKSHRMFSRAMSDFLSGYTAMERGPVIVKGGYSSEWFRLSPGDRRGVIAVKSLYEYTCRACGARGIANPGVWLGHRQADFTVCQDTCGVDHFGAKHPLVLSLDVASALDERFGGEDRGYRLSPIVDVFSDDGRRVLELLGRLQPLVASE